MSKIGFDPANASLSPQHEHQLFRGELRRGDCQVRPGQRGFLDLCVAQVCLCAGEGGVCPLAPAAPLPGQTEGGRHRRLLL